MVSYGDSPFDINKYFCEVIDMRNERTENPGKYNNRSKFNNNRKPRPEPNIPTDAIMISELLAMDIDAYIKYNGLDYRERDGAVFADMDQRITADDFQDGYGDNYVVQTLERHIKTDRDTHALKKATFAMVVWDCSSNYPVYYATATINGYNVGYVNVIPFRNGRPRNLDRATWTNRKPYTRPEVADTKKDEVQTNTFTGESGAYPITCRSTECNITEDTASACGCGSDEDNEVTGNGPQE